MFDFFEMMSFGKEIEAHGKRYIQIKYLRDGWHLAAEAGATSPAQVFLVYIEPKEEVKKPEGA